MAYLAAASRPPAPPPPLVCRPRACWTGSFRVSRWNSTRIAFERLCLGAGGTSHALPSTVLLSAPCYASLHSLLSRPLPVLVLRGLLCRVCRFIARLTRLRHPRAAGGASSGGPRARRAVRASALIASVNKSERNKREPPRIDFPALSTEQLCLAFFFCICETPVFHFRRERFERVESVVVFNLDFRDAILENRKYDCFLRSSFCELVR